jgi:DNA-binding phage protein
MNQYTTTIKQRMADLNMGQRLLAHKAGVTLQTVNTVINNPENCNMGSVTKVLSVLGLTLYVFPVNAAP